MTSSLREVLKSEASLSEIKFDYRNKSEGLEFLLKIKTERIPLVFFDPQYRGVLDYLKFGNEGKQRGQERASLPQMTEEIPEFVSEISRILKPSGHLMLWVDKYHLMNGFQKWLDGTNLQTVDMITWNKKRMGMGYRSRRYCEYLIVAQKKPLRAKDVWTDHTIPDVWEEKVDRAKGIHPKPVALQSALIKSLTDENDIVVDPAAGSFSVMRSCGATGRVFLGCDING